MSLALFILSFFPFASIDSFMTQVNAESIVDTTPAKYDAGNYSLDDMVNVFTRYGNRALGIIGSIALLFFVYGGILFLISGGSSEKITKAKSVLVAATIGLIIVFSSYLIIKFVLQALGRDDFDGSQMIIQENHYINSLEKISKK